MAWFFDKLEEEALRVLRLVLKDRILVREVELEGERWSSRRLDFTTAEQAQVEKRMSALAWAIAEDAIAVLPEGVRAELVVCFTHEALLGDERCSIVAWELRPLTAYGP